MAKKRNDVAAAKQRKQKMIALVGAVVLAILLVVQVPRTMRMVDGGGEEAAPPPAALAQQPAGGTVGSPNAAEDATSPAPAVELPTAVADVDLPDSDVAPEPDEGDLASFERFSSKDPFAQQIEATSDDGPAAPAAPAATGAAPAETSTTEAATGASAVPAAQTVSTTPSPTWSEAGASADAEPATRATAEISVNGKAEAVTVGKAFPKGDPTFRLVAVARQSVRIGIASGGKFTSGAKAIMLKKGKPLTLVNTEDGSRYQLILLSVG